MDSWPATEISHLLLKNASHCFIRIYGTQAWQIQKRQKIIIQSTSRSSVASSISTALNYLLIFGSSKVSVDIWIQSSLFCWMWEPNLRTRELSTWLKVSTETKMLVVWLVWWVWMLTSPQKKEATRRVNNRAVSTHGWKSPSFLFKKHKSMSILLPIFWIKTHKELLVFCMCCLVLGLPIAIKLWLNLRLMNPTCWNTVTSRWFWIPTWKKKITNRPTCTWQRIVFSVWVFTAKLRKNTI